MAWAVTLRITDCETGGAVIGFISDGFTTFSTDPYGHFIAVIGDLYTSYVVSCSAVNYNATTFHIDRGQHAGTIQTICLNRAAAGGEGWDGW